MAHLGELKFQLCSSEGQGTRSFSSGFETSGLRDPHGRVHSPWLGSRPPGPSGLIAQGCLLCPAALARLLLEDAHTALGLAHLCSPKTATVMLV